MRFGSNPRLLFAPARPLLAMAVLLAFCVTASAADDKSDTVVLGVPGYEVFERYKDEGYTTAESVGEALDEFKPTTPFTRLLILKNAPSSTATPDSWHIPAGTTWPAKLKTIEGGSLTKPYDVRLQAESSAQPMFQFDGVGESGSPFVIRGVALAGAQNAVNAGGASQIELDRCYIRSNQSHGVLVGGTSNVKLTNCVFTSNEDGVRVEGGHAEIVHCTFYMNNRGSAIRQLTGSVSATNTLMVFNQYGVRAAEEAAVTLNGCNAWQNTTNYDPATLKGSNHELEVLFAQPAAWQGKLDNSGAGLIANIGIKIGVGGAGVAIDFEGEGRGSPPYIGADEPNPGDVTGFWSRCVVYTAPIGRNGGDVLVHYSGTIGDLNNALYLVPQGVPAASKAFQIPVPLEGDDGVYWGRIGQIDTILGEADGETYIADGLGRFILWYTATRYLDTPDENTHIVDQAIPGRKEILIDTIPPVVDLNWYNLGLVSWGGPPATSFAAIGVPWGTPLYPYPGITGFPQVDAPGNSGSGAVYAPYDEFPDYTLYATQGPFEPPKYIFNVGSVANGYNLAASEQWLAMSISAMFFDPDVYTAKGLPVGEERPTAGFGTYDDETGFFANRYFGSDWVLQGLPAGWQVQGQDQGILAMSPVNFSCATGATGMAATWNAAIPVIQGFNPQLERLHLVGDLLAVDRAGNFGDTDTLDRGIVPPLQVSWLSGFSIRVDFRTRMYGSWPEVAWSLNDSGLNIIKANLSNPRPIYTYRIYGAQSYGIANADPIYRPLTGWSGWSTDSILRASFFDPNITPFDEPITDRWLLVVVGGCDEAGNVTQWDYESLQQDPGDPEYPNGDIMLLDTGQTSGRNWVRVYVPGKTMQIDTILYANLFYLSEDGQRRDFGPAPILSYPPPGVKLYAEFNARLLVNDPSLWDNTLHTLGVSFAGQANGSNFMSPPIQYFDTQGADIIPFMLPYLDANGERMPLELGSPSNVMTYTVSAATVVDFELESEIQDQTPATFSFKVVPGTVDDYLRQAGGQQPVKQFEAR